MADKAVILIVNRERILVDLLVRSLDGDDLAVFGASSVEDANRLFQRRKPDLVIVDPTLDEGFAFMDQVGSGLNPPTVLALVDSDEVRARVAATGIERMADKTLGLDALVDAIRSSLASGHPVPAGVEGGRTRVLVADDDDGMRMTLGACRELAPSKQESTTYEPSLVCKLLILGCRLLIPDRLLADYLGGRGYSVVPASDGLEAVNAVERDSSIRIVLLDVSMPRMGGLEALGSIMARPNHPDVIMMTAVTDREIARQTLEAGAFDYVLKPFDLDSIDTSIVACLSYSDYHRQPWWKRLVRSA